MTAAPLQPPPHDARVAPLERRLRLVRSLHLLFTRERDPQRLLDSTCATLVSTGDYGAAWIGQAIPGGVQAVAHAGHASVHVGQALMTWEEGRTEGGVIQAALRTRRPSLAPDAGSDPDHAPWREALRGQGLVAVAALPLLPERRSLEVLCVYAPRPLALPSEELELLEELAGHLAFALRTLEAQATRKRAEAQQQMLVSAMTSAANAIVITHRTGAIAWVNPAFTRLTGYTMAECERRNVRLLKSGRHDRAFYERLWRTILDGRVWRERMFNRRKDGSIYLEENTIAPVRNEAGVIDHFIAVKDDITQRYQAEETLRRSEERLRLAVEAAQLGMWDRDLKNNALHWSTEQERIMGYAPGTFPGTPEAFLELIHPDSLATHAAAQDRVRNGDGVFEAELHFRCRDGSDRWGYLRGRALRDPAGNLDRIIGVMVDVTKRQEAERALRESDERFRILFEYAPDAYYLHDLEGKFVGGNLAAEQLIGYQREELIGKSFLDLNLVASGDLAKAASTLRRSSQGEPTGPEAFTLRCKDGRLVTAEMRTYPMRIGQQMLVLGLARDITERRRAEAALEQSEAQLRAMFELVSIGMAQADVHTGQWLRVNQKMCEITGYSAEEMLRLRVPEVTHPEDREEDWQAFQRVVRGEAASYRLEKRYVRKDGAVTWVNVNMSVIRDAAGQPWRTVATIEDISERRQVQQQISDALGYSRTLLDSVPIGIITYRATGEAVSANARVARMKGGTIGTILAQNFRQLESWRESGLLAAAETALRTGQAQHLEVHHRSTFGQQLWVFSTLVPFHYAGQAHLLAVLEDISERKRAEEQIRKLALAVEQSPVSIIITDRDGTIEFVNPKFTQVTGYTAAEALGKNPRLLKSGETSAAEYQQLWATIRAGGEWRGEFRNKRRDGTLFWETATISPLRDVAGTITHFIAVKEDITEKRLLESKFLRAQRLESIGCLANGIAHDLNNILTPIIMCAPLLSVAETPERRQALGQTIVDSAQRAADIVRQLLTFARGKEGSRQILHLRHLLRDVTKIARETFPRTIGVEEQCATDLWTVSADATQIHQVLLNLCVNARDAMPTGGKLTLRADNVILDEHFVSMHREAMAGPFVRIEVSDTGVGISEENQNRLFETFFTTKDEGQGTGLGLVTSRGIVRDHHGFLTFKSQVGKGSSFIIHLPAVLDDAWPGPEGPRPDPVAPRGNGEKVLVVDDEPAVCEGTRLTLERHGYAVLLAGNGIEGLAQFSHQRADLRAVVTDLMMPLMDGVTFCRTLRAISPEIPIIVSSGGLFGKGATDALRVFDELGGIRVIPKPHTANELLEALGAILNAPSPPEGGGS